MERSRENVCQKSLDEYVDVVASIYNKHDKNRSIWDVWCHALHHAAGIAQQVRLDSAGARTLQEVADFSLWLFTMVLKLRGEFGRSGDGPEGPQDAFIRIQSGCSDFLWNSYPNACPFCFGGKVVEASSKFTGAEMFDQCECKELPSPAEAPNTRQIRIEELRRHSEQTRGKKPINIDDWQEMFGAVFASSVNKLTLTEITLRLMETLGQASDAMIRMYSYTLKDFVKGEPNRRQASLEARFADVFSWLFLLVEKLHRLKIKEQVEFSGRVPMAIPRIQLSQIIWERYGSESSGSFKCSKCGHGNCDCEIVLVPHTHRAEELIEKFGANLD